MLMAIVRRIIFWSVMIVCVAATAIWLFIVNLNDRFDLAPNDLIGRSFLELQSEYGPAVLGPTENARWYFRTSIFGLSATKGIEVFFKREPTKPHGLGPVNQALPFWVILDFFHLNMIYEPGAKRGIFCSTRSLNCSVWF